MPAESQHTEWKVAWHDDHLRWICGFANADGGRLELGRDDKGKITGLANAFFRAGQIEAWGRGIERIFAACRKAGTPKPKIRLEAGGIWTEFTFGPGYLKAISPAASKTEANNLGRGEKWGEKWGEKILHRRRHIARLMLDNPKISTLELASALKMSTSGVEKHLGALREAGLVRRIGPAKGGHWEVVL